MDLHLLPAPIAYVRHLVDVEDDNRAKFDQLRVMAQNTLQVVAAILINDCLRLGLVSELPTQPTTKRLAVGDFATFISEAADALMSRVEHSYVPELVQLYGEKNKETRQRRDRLQLIVQNRNRDAHTASLAQSGAWLDELVPVLDVILEELDCLRNYTMVSARNVEPAPDRRSSHVNGVACHGFSERYVPIKLPISQMVSRCEVILIKSGSSDWLSLRPWFLYFWEDDGRLRTRTGELALLNVINNRRLDYIGLVSGEEYRVDNEWRSFTMYEFETPEAHPITDAQQDVIGTEPDEFHDLGTYKLNDSEISNLLRRLTKADENIIIKQQQGFGGEDYLVSVRTPVREVAVATIDPSGEVQIFTRMLGRAVQERLIEKTRFERVLSELGKSEAGETNWGGALLKIGHISERVDWLKALARCFSH